LPDVTLKYFDSLTTRPCVQDDAPNRFQSNDAPDDPFIVAFQGGADSLDPIMRSVTVAYSWQRGIFDTITHQLRNGDVVPRIATSWKKSARALNFMMAAR